MGDKFKRVQPGQRVGIPAGAWNSMLEAAKAHEQSKFNTLADSEPQLAQADICKVINTTGESMSSSESDSDSDSASESESKTTR